MVRPVLPPAKSHFSGWILMNIYPPRVVWRFRRTLALATVPILAALLAAVGAASAEQTSSADRLRFDWPQSRGPDQDRTSRETGLIDQWDPAGGEGSHLLWKQPELAGRSTPIVMDGRLITLTRSFPGTPREGEKVVCADAATGEILWEKPFNVYLSDVPAERVGWSCCTGDPETGLLYAQGVCGLFQCLEAKTGKTVWSRSLHEEFGLLSTYGGRTNVPVIFEDLVVVSGIVIGWGEMAKPAHRFIAFDKHTGEPVWFRGTRPLPYDTTYSTPTVCILGGQAALVFGSGDGAVWALQPRTGAPIWHYRFSRRGLNVSPLVIGNTVFMGHAEENITGNRMGGFVALDATGQGDLTDTPLWRHEEIMVGKSSPVPVGDRILVVDNGAKLYLFDPATGEQTLRKSLGGSMFSSPLVADGKVYLCTENRNWYILRVEQDRVTILDRDRMPQREGSYGSPIVANGRIYVPTTGNMYCFGKPGREPTGTPPPEMPRETPMSPDAATAQVQVVPCEVLLHPGESQKFRVRTFNARGQQMDAAGDTALSVNGQGTLAAEGVFTAPADNRHLTATVTARLADQDGHARVRVAPTPPWRVDFSDRQIPEGWVGARYRHVPIDFDLREQLKAKNPLAEQLYLYFQTQFVNSRSAEARFSDDTPRREWTALMRFLRLPGAIASVPEARQALEPALQLLADNKVLSHWQWRDDPRTLSVEKGAGNSQGNFVMMKITTIPKGTRSRCWFGHPQQSNYTMQADVCGAIRESKMPDIGLIAQGYVVDMQGSSQKLQVRSWAPQLRMARTIDFAWRPEVWYTMKIQTRVEEDTAYVRSKVWVRGEPEPPEWTIVATDPSPNRSGSPGLFGNANDAEIFLDNLSITPNQDAEVSAASE